MLFTKDNDLRIGRFYDQRIQQKPQLANIGQVIQASHFCYFADGFAGEYLKQFSYRMMQFKNTYPYEKLPETETETAVYPDYRTTTYDEKDVWVSSLNYYTLDRQVELEQKYLDIYMDVLLAYNLRLSLGEFGEQRPLYLHMTNMMTINIMHLSKRLNLYS